MLKISERRPRILGLIGYPLLDSYYAIFKKAEGVMRWLPYTQKHFIPEILLHAGEKPTSALERTFKNGLWIDTKASRWKLIENFSYVEQDIHLYGYKMSSKEGQDKIELGPIRDDLCSTIEIPIFPKYSHLSKEYLELDELSQDFIDYYGYFFKNPKSKPFLGHPLKMPLSRNKDAS